MLSSTFVSDTEIHTVCNRDAPKDELLIFHLLILKLQLSSESVKQLVLTYFWFKHHLYWFLLNTDTETDHFVIATF